MYLSGQLTFHTTREDYDALLLRRQPNLPGTKIKVRRIVEIQTYKSRPALIPSHTERPKKDRATKMFVCGRDT